MSRIAFAAFSVALTMACTTDAAQFVISSNVADTYIGLNKDGNPTVGWNGDAEIIVGDDNPDSSKDAVAAIFMFELPDLAGEFISDAKLDFTITGSDWMSSTAKLDLYGLRYASTTQVLTTDYGFGPEPGNGVLIQDDLYAGFGGDMNFPIFVSAEGSTLVDFLSDLYQNGAVGGDYVFFRLNLDAMSANPARIASASYADPAYRPSLTITTVPEPSTYAALFGLGALGFAILRRRK